MLHTLAESNTAALLLSKTLREEQAAGLIEIRTAGPPSSLYAAARTLLAVRFEPVALVLDAGSTDPEAGRRQRRAAEEVVGEASEAAPLASWSRCPPWSRCSFCGPPPSSGPSGRSPRTCWSWAG